MQGLRIKLIQTKQFWEDKTANLSYFEDKFLSQIKSQSVDLILFPEMFNTSFSMNPIVLAEKMDGKSIQWLQMWASKLDTVIGASLMIEEEGKYYNRFVLVSEMGVESFYDKRHLFRMANEDDAFSPGENRVVFELKGWKLMLQVCYDLRFPVFSRNRRIGGEKEYDAVIYIANWPERRRNVWKTLLKARAIENQAYVIGVNRVGEDGNGIGYSGDSIIIDPWGETQADLSAHYEGVVNGKLNRDVLEDIKAKFPSYLDGDHFEI